MREVDKRYYKINIAGTDRIFTNVYRVGDRYSAYEADKNGKPGKFLYSLSQAEIDRAVISGSFDFKEALISKKKITAISIKGFW